MDHTTINLINAIELLLIAGNIPAPANHPDRWTFQEGSEIHIVLSEALFEARIASGMDKGIEGFEVTDLEAFAGTQ
jgi:hypothetical protein